MGLNLDKPQNWKKDIYDSVDMYNNWFINFASDAFRKTREKATLDVIDAIHKTNNLKNIIPNVIIENPEILPTLGMSTCPPIAVDRLIGLSGARPSLIKKIEKTGKLSEKAQSAYFKKDLEKICDVINKLLDKDIFTWLGNNENADQNSVERAATIIADRLCGSISNPIIRNAQEKRQLDLIKSWLEMHGYKQLESTPKIPIENFPTGYFAFHFNVQVDMNNSVGFVNIPVDCVVKSLDAKYDSLPLLIEAKSAGDFANVNKRRKEEAQKMLQLKETYGNNIKFILFLCGYFDTGYLGYEAAEGIDWIWEHSIDDLQYFLKVKNNDQ